MTELELVDQVLYEAESDGACVTGSTTAEYNSALRKARDYELIVKHGTSYRLTKLGREAPDSGGYGIWKEQTERLKSEIHQATLDSSKATVDAATSAKRSFWISLSSVLFSILSFALVVIQYNDSKNQKSDIDKQNVRIDSLSRVIKQLSISLQKASQR